MLRSFTLFFFGFVILEMALLITLGRALGVVPTIVVVLGAGLAGAWLARREGLRAAMRMRSQMAQGAIPAAEMTDGLLIAVAAVLLIIPGVLTDVVGIALLFPPTRALLKHAVIGQVTRRSPVGQFAFDQQARTAAAAATPRGDQIIDARVIDTRVVDE